MNWTAPEIFIHASDELSLPMARQLAETTGLPMSETQPTGWQLRVSKNQLALVRTDGVSVNVDFINGKANRRAREPNLKKQPLARALGVHKRSSAISSGADTPPNNAMLSVIDATAGFGTDAWMMAAMGCSVTLLEQSPVLCALLEHALIAAKSNATSANTANQLELMNTNAIDYLQNRTTAQADIVYLDPMYPITRKQALVKKGMQLLHELIGPDDNSATLLHAALCKASYRVVVKRPPMVWSSDPG